MTSDNSLIANTSDIYDFSLEDLVKETSVVTENNDDDNLSAIDDVDYDHYENLSEVIDEEQLDIIASDVVRQFKADDESRRPWLDNICDGLSLLGVRIEETDDPFPGACGAHHPLIIESAVKFQARASSELFNPKGPVKTKIIGNHTPEKEEQSKRIRNHMNYQVTDQMEEFFEETEQALFYLPIIGSAIKKLYYNASLKRPVSEFIPIDQFVVSHFCTNLNNAPSYTHVFPVTENQFKMDVDNGLYRDIDIGEPEKIDHGEFERTVQEIMGYNTTEEYKGYKFLEHYTYLDIDEGKPEGYKGKASLPYVVTVDMSTEKVLSIRRNWQEGDETFKRNINFVHYPYVRGMGFYGLGLIHLLGNLQMTLTSTMRSLVDSGQFANLNAGFVDKRLRVRNNDGAMYPGELKEVEAGGISLKDAIFMLPTKDPSAVLLQMYQFIEQRAQKFADSTEQVIADSTNYGPVGTTLALLEASTKFFSGVHKRLHRAQKQEFQILAKINYEYLDDILEFDYNDTSHEIYKEDYDGRVDVIPVSDPNMSSQSQRTMISQSVMQNALANPDIHDRREASKEYYLSIGIDDEKIEKLLPSPEEPQQLDPISDILTAQQGKPIKAFSGQDHQSHIKIKMSFLQDPMSGANPVFQAIAPVISANIQEHIILDFQEKVAAQAQQVEAATVEQAVAMAAEQLAQTNQRLQELESQGIDAAKNKIADAEVLRAQVQSQEASAKIESQQFTDRLKAQKHLFDHEKEQNRLLIASMQEETKRMEAQMKGMTDLMNQVLSQVQSLKNQQNS